MNTGEIKLAGSVDTFRMAGHTHSRFDCYGQGLIFIGGTIAYDMIRGDHRLVNQAKTQVIPIVVIQSKLTTS